MRRAAIEGLEINRVFEDFERFRRLNSRNADFGGEEFGDAPYF